MPEKGLTAAQRRLRAQFAANDSWARTPDRSARTAPARKAMLDKFEQQVDPDGTLTPAERAKRAESARKAHFQRLAFKSAQARSRRKIVVDSKIAELDGGASGAA